MVSALLTRCLSNDIFKIMDEQLVRLVKEAQRHTPQIEEWHLALMRLVEEILRSRKVGRSPIGQPLRGVYREIYEQARQQLLGDVGKKLDQYNLKQTTVRAWTHTLRNQAFKTILDDQHLKNLAIEAQQHPPYTELRQHALGELVEAIRLSGRLCRPQRGSFSPQFYDLLYEEAINKTLTYVCQRIDNYDPERGDKKFTNWVNFRLERIFIEARHEFRDPSVSDLPSLPELEAIEQPEEPPSRFAEVRQAIEADPKNIFKRAYIRNRPDANFQAIALARFSGESWQGISTEFAIPLPTLSRFFQRCCAKFRSQLKNC